MYACVCHCVCVCVCVCVHVWRGRGKLGKAHWLKPCSTVILQPIEGGGKKLTLLWRKKLSSLRGEVSSFPLYNPLFPVSSLPLYNPLFPVSSFPLNNHPLP